MVPKGKGEYWPCVFSSPIPLTTHPRGVQILPEESTRRVVEKMEKYKTIERIQWEGALAIKLRVEAGGTKALKGARAALAGRPGAAAQESKAPSGSDGGAERKESITQAERVVFRWATTCTRMPRHGGPPC